MNKIKTIVAGLTMVALMATASPALGTTADDLLTQIQALQNQLNQLLAQYQELTGEDPDVDVPAACVGITFNRNLSQGSSGNDVKCLQALLNTDTDTKLAETGAGSPGNETTYFGSITKAGVIKFQNKYAAEVLAQWGLTAGTGFVGSSTRAKLNSILDAGVEPDPDPDDPPVTQSTISLAVDNPAAVTLVTSANHGSQGLAPMVKLNFANGTASEVKVTTLRLTRTGIATDADLANAYLYDGMTRLAEVTSVSDKVYSFVNTAGLFSIPANSTKSILVSADLANLALSGKTIALGVASAADIVADGITFGGNFPINGNMMSLATVTDIGRLTVGTSVTAPASVDPGMTDREVLRFNMVAENQNLSVSYVKFTNVGTIANTDLANLKLMDGTTQLGSTLTSLASDNTAVFDLSANPLAITSGAIKSLTVVADIVGGTNRSFKLTIQRQSDIMVRDAGYGIYVKPYTHATTETFSVIEPSATNITTGSLAINIHTDSPSGNVALGATNVELARFHFVASGEAVRVLTLPFQINITGTGGTKIRNVRMTIDGSQVGTTIASAEHNTAVTFPTGGDFGNSFIIPAGTTGKMVSIRADIKEPSGETALADSQVIVARINAGTGQGMVSLTSINPVQTTGRSLTIATGALTVAKNIAMSEASSAAPTGVPGSTNVRVASFTVTAGAGEGVNVNSFAIKDATSAFDNLQNVKLMYGDTQIGVTQSSVTTGQTYTFIPATAISLAAGQSMVINVFADIVTGSGTGNQGNIVLDQVTGIGAQTSSTANYTTDVTGQQIHIVAAGSYSLAIATDTPVSEQYIMGVTGQTFAKYRVTAGTGEDIRINKLIVVNDTTAGKEGGLINLSLYIDGGKIGDTVPSFSALTRTNTAQAGAATTITLDAGASATDDAYNGMYIWIKSDTGIGQIRKITDYVGSTKIATVDSAWATNPDATSVFVIGSVAIFDLSASPITVLANMSKTIDVKADVNVGAGFSKSSHTLKVMANAGIGGEGVTTGSLANLSAASVNAEAASVYLTKISVAYAADSPSGASSGGTGQLVAKFVVFNTANALGYDAVLNQLKPTISSTIVLSTVTNTLTNYDIKIYKGSIAEVNRLATIRHCLAEGTANCTEASSAGDYRTNVDLTKALTGSYSTQNFGAAKTHFKDVSIASGGSVTLFVTADTQTAATGKNFSCSVAADANAPGGTVHATDSVIWSDGITADLNVVDGLPLVPVRTLTY